MPPGCAARGRPPAPRRATPAGTTPARTTPAGTPAGTTPGGTSAGVPAAFRRRRPAQTRRTARATPATRGTVMRRTLNWTTPARTPVTRTPIRITRTPIRITRTPARATRRARTGIAAGRTAGEQRPDLAGTTPVTPGGTTPVTPGGTTPVTPGESGPAMPAGETRPARTSSGASGVT